MNIKALINTHILFNVHNHFCIPCSPSQLAMCLQYLHNFLQIHKSQGHVLMAKALGGTTLSQSQSQSQLTIAQPQNAKRQVQEQQQHYASLVVVSCCNLLADQLQKAKMQRLCFKLKSEFNCAVRCKRISLEMIRFVFYLHFKSI